METALRIIGAVPFVLIGLVGAGVLLRRLGWPRGHGSLELELVETTAGLEDLIGDLDDPRRQRHRARRVLDFVFTVSYLALFVTLSVVLAYREGAWATWVAVAAASTATLGALLDIRENLATLRLLATPLDKTTPRMVAHMRTAALAKWTLIAITTALLSALFWGDRHFLVTVVGVAWTLVSGLGVIAVVQPTLLRWFFGVEVVVVALTLVLLLGWPATFLEGF